jgi:hypothetical protein
MTKTAKWHKTTEETLLLMYMRQAKTPEGRAVQARVIERLELALMIERAGK